MTVLASPYSTPLWHAPYRSIRPWSIGLYVLFAAQIASAGHVALSAQAWYDALSQTRFGGTPPADSELTFRISVVIRDAWTFITLAVFLAWAYRAQRNLPSLGVKRPRFTPLWAVAWYFVPIYSLIRPYQAMSETFAGSDPVGLTTDDGKAHGGGELVLAWWCMFLVMAWLAWSTWREELSARNYPAAQMTVCNWEVVFSAATAVHAVLAMLLVQAISERQQRRDAICRNHAGE